MARRQAASRWFTNSYVQVRLMESAIIRSGVSWRQSWTGFIHVGIYGVRVLYPGSSIWYSPRIWQNGTDGSVALDQLGSRRASSSKKFNM
ncbi:hypothetical protein BDL97_01G048900 [Sphagnum fallax]|nr:hypothetical protein BDL97_01G048900 [Sphagnum fallax]